jgi:hypothetical protein
MHSTGSAPPSNTLDAYTPADCGLSDPSTLHSFGGPDLPNERPHEDTTEAERDPFPANEIRSDDPQRISLNPRLKPLQSVQFRLTS